MLAENRSGPSDRCSDRAFLENSSVVFSANELISGQSSGSTSSRQLANSPSYGCTAPTQEENNIDSMQIIRTSIMQTDISSKAADIIMQSWSEGSIKQYSTYLRTWMELCGKWNTNPYDPPITRVLDYLTSLFERGLRYDAINTAKSAISAIATPKNGISLGSQPLISRFMKGIFKSRPPTPRYQSTWDIQPMLSHLVSLGPATEMDLKSLTHKLVMLIALVSAQRTQSIHLLDLHFMKLSTDAVEFVIPGRIKQSRPGYKVQPVLLKAYPIDRHLCVVTHLNEYIERTKSLRSVESRLFISYVKPHKGVSKDTISRWIRTVMTDAGIDVNVFKPHSTRSAATSKALQSCVPIQDVLKQAGWSNQRTFDSVVL